MKCAYKKGKLNGKHIQYYSNGNPIVIANYINGLIEGILNRYYDNGNLHSSLNYINGKKEGECVFYYKTASPTISSPDKKELARMSYSNDKLNGKYISWSGSWIANENDIKIEPPTWNETYKIEGCFENGKPTGIFKFWYGKLNLLSGEMKPTNTYSRKVFQRGELVDDGWERSGGHVVKFESNGELTEDYKYILTRYNGDGRFTKKYFTPCDNYQPSDNSANQSNHLKEKKNENNLISVPDSVVDIEGNIYHTISIGTQVWMVENLKTTKYRDGTDIPNVTNNTDWNNLTTPGYCWYNNDISNKNTCGALYNWYTVNTGNLCPEGWHVPSASDWETLIEYLDLNDYRGILLIKTILTSSGLTLDEVKGNGENNQSGKDRSFFKAVPAGGRYFDGLFMHIGSKGNLWSSTESTELFSKYKRLQYKENEGLGSLHKRFGFSVRCVRD